LLQRILCYILEETNYLTESNRKAKLLERNLGLVFTLREERTVSEPALTAVETVTIKKVLQVASSD